MSGSPRRSFRDAKVQRLENMAVDIAVGIAVLATARKNDRLLREEGARIREEERGCRELALRAKYAQERRGGALDALLEEIALLDRLRRLVTALRVEIGTATTARVGAFVAFAEDRLASREAAISADALEQRFSEKRLLGDDDDHDFRSPRYL